MIDLTRTIQVLADLRPPLQPVAAPSVPDFSQLPQLAQVFGNNPSQFMADHRVLIQDSHELIQLLAQALPECETTCRFLEHLIQSFIAEVTATLSVVCASSGANWVAVIKQLIVMPNKYIEQAVAHLQGLEQRLAPLTTRLEQISETKSSPTEKYRENPHSRAASLGPSPWKYFNNWEACSSLPPSPTRQAQPSDPSSASWCCSI